MGDHHTSVNSLHLEGTSITASSTISAPSAEGRRAPLLGTMDAQRALYVDYEGFKDRPPTLLGYLVNRTLAAGIVEPLFAPCHKKRRAEHAALADHRQLVECLVDRAEGENRLVVSWSRHDLRLMEGILQGDELRLGVLGRRYRDARLTARRCKIEFNGSDLLKVTP